MKTGPVLAVAEKAADLIKATIGKERTKRCEETKFSEGKGKRIGLMFGIDWNITAMASIFSEVLVGGKPSEYAKREVSTVCLPSVGAGANTAS